MSRRYLWDPSREPDPEVQRLERVLARYRFVERGTPRWSREGSRARIVPRVPQVIGGLLVAAAAVIVWMLVARDSEPAYRVEGLPGRDLVRAGDAIEVKAGEDARVVIGALGHVELDAGSRLRVEDCGKDAHRLYLERGRVRASIVAQPRAFQIDTPSGKTVDLGCAYELEVDASGAARVRVTSGQIEFTFDGREVYVPANASCTATPSAGPGWPELDARSGALDDVLAIARGKSIESKTPDAVLDELLAECTDEDTLTLWHVYDGSTKDGVADWVRQRVLVRLLREFPLPRGVTEEGVRSGDRAQRRAWRESMQPAWRKAYR